MYTHTLNRSSSVSVRSTTSVGSIRYCSLPPATSSLQFVQRRSPSIIYVTDGELTGPDRDMASDADIAPDEDDMPECLEGDEIDMGEIVVEHLGLGLDPYPRCSGVEFTAEDDEDPAKTSPFAVLRDLKSN